MLAACKTRTGYCHVNMIAIESIHQDYVKSGLGTVMLTWLI